MKIAILGYDVEGRASFEYFSARGHELAIRDRNLKLVVPDGIPSVLGDDYLDDLDQYDLLVRTPGLLPQVILDKNPSVEDKISSQINEFLRVCPTKNVIGVTGTKGKGTTSTLISKILEEAKFDVRLGGNIGVPPLTFLNELTPDSWVVLELSNFQLIDIKTSPHIAVCLAVVPEHLDWHYNMENYVEAKSNLFIHQKTDDIAIYFETNELSKKVASTSKGHKTPFFASPGAEVSDDAIVIDGQEICKTNELKLPGRHNWQNICAAVTASWQVTQDIPSIRSALLSFTSLEHRIEFVKEAGGVRFYNDSYSSGLNATEAAIEAIAGKKVMILGGYDRMLDIDEFGPFALSHQDDFRTFLIIGQSAERLAGSLKRAGFTNYVLKPDLKTMKDVVIEAQSLAQPGDAVVLSPGFASFDMFKNFTDRGQQFKAEVQNL